jgi:transglutaminase-like putative cysteine protease
LKEYLQPTKLLPTDSIVKQRATEITKAAKTDVGKARALYDWIVENTYHNPKTRGCASVISDSCWNREISAASAPI